MRAAGETGPGADRASAGRGTGSQDQWPSSCLPAPHSAWLSVRTHFAYFRVVGRRHPFWRIQTKCICKDVVDLWCSLGQAWVGGL